MFIEALFTIAKTWKQPKGPRINEWIKKMWYIYIQWNVTQPFKKKKKEEILPFVTIWMDLECIMLSEISLSEKDKYL